MIQCLLWPSQCYEVLLRSYTPINAFHSDRKDGLCRSLPTITIIIWNYCATRFNYLWIPCIRFDGISLSPLCLHWIQIPITYTCYPLLILWVVRRINRRKWIDRNTHWNQSTLSSNPTDVSPYKSVSLIEERKNHLPPTTTRAGECLK